MSMPRKCRRPSCLLSLLASLVLALVGCDHDDSTGPESPTVEVLSLDVHGMGSSGIGAIEFVRSVGSCEIQAASISAIIYAVVPWPGRDLTVLNVVAPTRDNLHVLFL